VRELNGEIRLQWDEHRPGKKEIYSTRSFGQRVTSKDELRMSLIAHAEAVARKLRKQGSATKTLVVFASNSVHDDERLYSKSMVVKLETASCDTRVIAQHVSSVINILYRAGIRFHKSGVGALDIRPSVELQQDMFSTNEDNIGLMTCLDDINARYGKGTLHVAAKGFVRNSTMKRDYLSPQYTTNWAHIPKVNCN